MFNINRLKKIIATILAALTLTTAGLCTVPASAANKTNYNCSTSYTHYTGMRLTNKKKSGSATFYIGCTSTSGKVKVKLTNGSGRWLWESNLGFRCGYYKFHLGNDNSAYRFYFKKAGGKGGVAISFVGGSNITR